MKTRNRNETNRKISIENTWSCWCLTQTVSGVHLLLQEIHTHFLDRFNLVLVSGVQQRLNIITVHWDSEIESKHAWALNACEIRVMHLWRVLPSRVDKLHQQLDDLRFCSTKLHLVIGGLHHTRCTCKSSRICFRCVCV